MEHLITSTTRSKHGDGFIRPASSKSSIASATEGWFGIANIGI